MSTIPNLFRLNAPGKRNEIAPAVRAGRSIIESATASIPRHIPALTGLRWLAASLVFLHHFTPHAPRAGLAWLLPVCYRGSVGVALFFTLSGFLLARACYERHAESRFVLSDYLLRRFARVYPLYWVLLVSVLVVTTHPVPRKVFALCFFLLQNSFDDLKFALVPTAWSLSVEEGFYLVLPAIVAALIRFGKLRPEGPILRPLAILASACAVFIASGIALQALPFKWAGFYANQSHWWLYTLCGRFFQFATGMALAIWFVARPRQARAWLAPLPANLAFVVATASLIGLIEYHTAIGGLSERRGVILDCVYGVPAALLIFSLCGSSIGARLLSCSPAVFGGKISYALYLIQVLPWIGPILHRLVPGAHASWLGCGLAYLTCSSIAAVCYVSIERPLQNLILGLSRRS